MTTSHTLTGDIRDLGLDDPNAQVWLGTNLGPNDALSDLDNDKVVLRGRTRIPLTGTTFSIDLIATNSTGILPSDGSLRYIVYVEYRSAGPRPSRETWNSGYFELTGNLDLSDAVGTAYLDPTFTVNADDIVSGLIETPGSAVETALAAQFAPGGAAGNLTSGDVLTMVASGAASRSRVVLIGDSITDQCTNKGGDADPSAMSTFRAFNVEGFWTWTQMRLGHRATLTREAGVAGETTAQMLARFATDVASQPADVAVIFGGINDKNVPLAASVTVANLQGMAEQALAVGKQVVLCTLLSSTTDAPELARLTTINSWIRDYCRATRGVHLCDWRDTFVSPFTNAPETGLGFDSVHPNGNGASYMGKVLADVIAPLVVGSEDLIESNGDTRLISTNPRMQGTGGTKPGAYSGDVSNSWTTAQGDVSSGVPSTGAVTLAKVARTDGRLGVWQQAQITTPAGFWMYQSISSGLGSTWNVGDTVRAELEFERSDDWVNPRYLNLRVGFSGAAGRYTEDVSNGWLNNTKNALIPMRGVLRTPEFVIPAGTTGFVVGFRFAADAGTIRIDRYGLVRTRTP